MSNENTKRIMLVGESKTGKTSIINYLFKNRKIPEEHYPTMGVEAGIKTIEYGDGKFAVVQIWDSAGKRDLHEYVCEKFYGDIDGFLIVTDVTNENALAEINFWKKKIRTVKNRTKGPYKIGVLANKADLKPHWLNSHKLSEYHPEIKFFKLFSLKENSEGKHETEAEKAIFDFVKEVYMDNLPQIVINSEADHGEGGCKCSVM